MGKSGVLLALGLAENATPEEIQDFIDEKQNALQIKLANSEDETTNQAYEQELKDLLDASAILLESETDKEQVSQSEVRATIIAKMSGQPTFEAANITSDYSFDITPDLSSANISSSSGTTQIEEKKPKSRWIGFVVASVILVVVVVTVVINYDSLVNYKTDETILEIAAVEKILGEIGTYQRQLENARTDLAHDIKTAEINVPTNSADFYNWKKNAYNAIFNSSLLIELEGELRMGKSMFQQESLPQAHQILSSVKDGYVEVLQQYNAVVEVFSLTKTINEYKSLWNSLQTDYDITEPLEISLVNHNIISANAAFDAGDFLKTRQHMKTAAGNWQQVHQSVKEQVNRIEQQRQQQALLDEAEVERLRQEKIETRKREIAKAAAELELQANAEKERELLADIEKEKNAALALKLEKEAEEKRLALIEEKRLALIEEKKLNLVKKPKLLEFVKPKYPRRALLGNKEGWVDIQFTIATDGSTKDIELINSSPKKTFDQAAITAFKKWKFEPFTEGGQAVDQPNVKYRILFIQD